MVDRRFADDMLAIFGQDSCLRRQPVQALHEREDGLVRQVGGGEDDVFEMAQTHQVAQVIQRTEARQVRPA